MLLTLQLVHCTLPSTRYGHISSEWKSGDDEKQNGLFSLPRGFFYRVVLDEAHKIKNPSTVVSKACADIGNRRVKTRWCLTGTPIQNKLLDIYPLARFLQIPHCATKREFKRYLGLRDGGQEVLSGHTKVKVTAFLAAHMLRRLKCDVVDHLVSKTEQVLELHFDEAEEGLYKAFQRRARSRFDSLVRKGIARRNYVHILALLVRLRQICDHPLLVAGANQEDDDLDLRMSLTAEMGDPLEKLDPAIIRRLNERETSILDSECPICIDVFSDGAMFPNCGHLICRGIWCLCVCS